MASGSKTCPEGFFSLRCRCHKNCSSTKKNFFYFSRCNAFLQTFGEFLLQIFFAIFLQNKRNMDVTFFYSFSSRMFPSLVNCCTLDWFTEWPGIIKIVYKKGGLHSTEEAFLLPTQQTQVRIMAPPRCVLFTAWFVNSIQIESI